MLKVNGSARGARVAG